MNTEATKFVKDQLRDTMIKVRGALNLLEDGKPIYARNKILGVNQKLNYIYLKIEEYEKSGAILDSANAPIVSTQVNNEKDNNTISEIKN